MSDLPHWCKHSRLIQHNAIWCPVDGRVSPHHSIDSNIYADLGIMVSDLALLESMLNFQVNGLQRLTSWLGQDGLVKFECGNDLTDNYLPKSLEAIDTILIFW